MNDSYANFRFANRATEVLSPLSTGKFGFFTMSQMSKKMRKMSETQHQTLAPHSEIVSMRQSCVGNDRGEPSRSFNYSNQTTNGFARNKQQ